MTLEEMKTAAFRGFNVAEFFGCTGCCIDRLNRHVLRAFVVGASSGRKILPLTCRG